MDQALWSGDKPLFDVLYIGDGDAKVSIADLPVCPGWLVRQPAVTQIAHAHSVYEKGLIADYYPTKPAVIMQGAALLSRVINSYQAHKMASE